MKNYIQVSITVMSQDEASFIMAALAETEFEGIEETPHTLVVFYDEEKFDRGEFSKILKPFNVKFTESIHEERNWNEEWESGFTPVVIGDYAAIRANFHEPIKGVQHEILITPKMSFGTGHHATTSMMIRMMKDVKIDGKSVLDLGTGTGVLAILASKLGAAQVTAIDNDDWSIRNATENFEANGIQNITLLHGDTLDEGGLYDVVLANINLNVLVSMAAQLGGVTVAGAKLLVSGFYVSDQKVILDAFEKQGFKMISELEDSGWQCLMLEKHT